MLHKSEQKVPVGEKHQSNKLFFTITDVCEPTLSPPKASLSSLSPKNAHASPF